MPTLAKPRYEPRTLPTKRAAVFDTFDQSFCVGEEFATLAEAIRASSRMNAAYERAIAE
jgi:hypothetical protein